jgi:hypothetical protein
MHRLVYSVRFGLFATSLITLGKASDPLLIRSDEVVNFFSGCPCTQNDYVKDFGSPSSCLASACGRRVADGLFQDEDIANLARIVKKGMSQRSSDGGPTILDINTGFIRDTNGIENLFMRSESVYSDDDFAHYGEIIRRLKLAVTQTFNITELYFTAPTFITRLDGRPGWEPAGNSLPLFLVVLWFPP